MELVETSIKLTEEKLEEIKKLDFADVDLQLNQLEKYVLFIKLQGVIEAVAFLNEKGICCKEIINTKSENFNKVKAILEFEYKSILNAMGNES